MDAVVDVPLASPSGPGGSEAFRFADPDLPDEVAERCLQRAHLHAAATQLIKKVSVPEKTDSLLLVG